MNHIGFYEELDILREDVDEESDFGFLENEFIEDHFNAYDFLHGFCDVFAITLSNIFSYDMECIMNENGLVHAYCKKEIDGRTFFIDVRGITDDYKEFIEEFGDFLDYFDIPNYPVEGTTTMDKHISKNENFLKYEAFAKKLISNYKGYYKI